VSLQLPFRTGTGVDAVPPTSLQNWLHRPSHPPTSLQNWLSVTV
jgi:hypothetical protein